MPQPIDEKKILSRVSELLVQAKPNIVAFLCEFSKNKPQKELLPLGKCLKLPKIYLATIPRVGEIIRRQKPLLVKLVCHDLTPTRRHIITIYAEG